MDRRNFIGASAASGIMLLSSRTAFGYEANSSVRIGLLGCGSRGTTVATSFAKNTPAQVVALADLFPDQLAAAKAHFDELNASLGVPAIDPSLIFRGPHAFEQLAASSAVDSIQISTPPFFHVPHLEAAVAAGKHVYCEKPLGIDVAQAKQALEIGKRAKAATASTSASSAATRRPSPQVVRRIQAGDMGKIVCIAAHYNAPNAVSHTGANGPPTSTACATGSGTAPSPATSSLSRTSTSSISATGSSALTPSKPQPPAAATSSPTPAMLG